MSILNKELQEWKQLLKLALQRVGKCENIVKFRYIVSMNLHFVEQHLQRLKKVQEIKSDAFKLYEKKLNELFLRFSRFELVKLGEKEVAVRNFLPDRRDEYYACLDLLRKEYGSVIEQRAREVEQYLKLMEEDSGIVPLKILCKDFTEIPDDCKEEWKVLCRLVEIN